MGRAHALKVQPGGGGHFDHFLINSNNYRVIKLNSGSVLWMYHVSFKENIIQLGLLYVLTNAILQLNKKKNPAVSSPVKDSTHIPFNTRINW